MKNLSRRQNECCDWQNEIYNNFIKTIILLLLFVNTFNMKSEETSFRIPFIEKIMTVQEKVNPEKPTVGELSIPYTRLDVSINNGLMFCRLIQVYHNHGKENLGYAFTLPLKPDIMITQFNIWDRGKRYAGTIQDRLEAEKVYREVTGDETPTLNKDPGIVRQGGNIFEMRIFPIFPGESKQIELVWYRRLLMKDDMFNIELPIRELTIFSNRRTQQTSWMVNKTKQIPQPIISQLTDVSVFIRDDLPIHNLIYGSVLKPVKNDTYRYLMQAELKQVPKSNFTISYKLKLDKKVFPSLWTFSCSGKNYFLIRTVFKKEINKTDSVPENITKNSFYLGVWNSQVNPVKFIDNDNIKKRTIDNEISAFVQNFYSELGGLLVLSCLNQNQHGNYSYLPFIIEENNQQKKHKTPILDFQFKAAVSNGNFAPNNKVKLEKFLKTISDEKKPKSKTVTSKPDVYKHLINAITNEHCTCVYLLLKNFAPEEYNKIFDIIKNNPSVQFILITYINNLPDNFKLKNVNYYSVVKGWKFYNKNFLNSKNWQMDKSFGFDFVDFIIENLKINNPMDFLIKIPNQNPLLPKYRLSDNNKVSLKFYPDTNMERWGIIPVFSNVKGKQEKEKDTINVLWISGTTDKFKNILFKIRNPLIPIFSLFFQPLDFSGKGSPNLVPVEISFTANLKKGNPNDRFVGAYYVKNIVDNLDFRRGSWNTRSTELPSQEKTKIREEVVALSKEFSFISQETAFIALPKEIRKKYGFTSQRFGTEQVVNMKGLGKGGIPEPEEWLLIVMGFLTITFIMIRKTILSRKST